MVRRSSKNKIVLNKRSLISFERKNSNSPSTNSDDSTQSTSRMQDRNDKKSAIVFCSNKALAKKTHSSSVISTTTVDSKRMGRSSVTKAIDTQKMEIKPSTKNRTTTKSRKVVPTKYQWGFPGHLNKSELNVFNKFRNEVHRRGGSFCDTVLCFGDAEDESYALCRWLRARKFNFQNVIKMVEEATTLRAKASLHNFYPNPSDGLGNKVEKSIYLAQYPQIYTGYSKDGYPVLFSKPGVLNINGLESITNLDGIFNFHWYSMIHDFGDRLKHQVEGDDTFKRFECICILDMGNLTSAHNLRRALNIIKHQTQVDSLCFPETLNRLIIINAPSFFSMTWNIVSAWLDERTSQKIEIMSGNRKKWESKLRELIDLDQLPRDYGGRGCTTEQLLDEDMMKEDQDDRCCKKRLISKFLTVRSSATFEFELKQKEVMNDISIFTRSTSGAISFLSKKNGNAKVTKIAHKGKGLDTELPSRIYLPHQNIVGPGKFTIKLESNSSALSTDNFFIVGQIKTFRSDVDDDMKRVGQKEQLKRINEVANVDMNETTTNGMHSGCTNHERSSSPEEARSDQSKRIEMCESLDCESRETNNIPEHQQVNCEASVKEDNETKAESNTVCCGIENIMEMLPFITI